MTQQQRGVIFDRTGTINGKLGEKHGGVATPEMFDVREWVDRFKWLGKLGYNTIWFAYFYSSTNASKGGKTGGSWYPYHLDSEHGPPAEFVDWWKGGDCKRTLDRYGLTTVYTFNGKGVIPDPSKRDPGAGGDLEHKAWFNHQHTPNAKNPDDVALAREVIEQWAGVDVACHFLDNWSSGNTDGPRMFQALCNALPDLQLGTEAIKWERDPRTNAIVPVLEWAHLWALMTRSHAEQKDNDGNYKWRDDIYAWDLHSIPGRFWMWNSTVGRSQRVETQWYHDRAAQGFEPVYWAAESDLRDPKSLPAAGDLYPAQARA